MFDEGITYCGRFCLADFGGEDKGGDGKERDSTRERKKGQRKKRKNW